MAKAPRTLAQPCRARVSWCMPWMPVVHCGLRILRDAHRQELDELARSVENMKRVEERRHQCGDADAHEYNGPALGIQERHDVVHHEAVAKGPRVEHEGEDCDNGELHFPQPALGPNVERVCPLLEQQCEERRELQQEDGLVVPVERREEQVHRHDHRQAHRVVEAHDYEERRGVFVFLLRGAEKYMVGALQAILQLPPGLTERTVAGHRGTHLWAEPAEHGRHAERSPQAVLKKYADEVGTEDDRGLLVKVNAEGAIEGLLVEINPLRSPRLLCDKTAARCWWRTTG